MEQNDEWTQARRYMGAEILAKAGDTRASGTTDTPEEVNALQARANRSQDRPARGEPPKADTLSTEMYLVLRNRGYTGGLSPMSTSPLSPQEIRAAAAAHKDLGPEYSDAVIESFLERVDREIAARVDARLRPVSREQPVQPAQSNSRRTLLTGVAIGIVVTGVPSMMVAAGAGGVSPTNESKLLLVVAILWVIGVAIAAFVHPVSHSRRQEHGIRQTGRQAP